MDTKSHTDFSWCLNVFLSEQSSLQCAPRRARIAALQQQHHAGGRLLGKVRLRGDWLLPVWISSGVGACTEEDCGALVRWWGSFSLFLCTLCFSLLLVCYVPHVSNHTVNLKTNKKTSFLIIVLLQDKQEVVCSLWCFFLCGMHVSSRCQRSEVMFLISKLKTVLAAIFKTPCEKNVTWDSHMTALCVLWALKMKSYWAAAVRLTSGFLFQLHIFTVFQKAAKLFLTVLIDWELFCP